MIGYVYTSWGKRRLSEIAADIFLYLQCYGLDGILVDEFSTDAGLEGYYLHIRDYAKSIGMKMTTGNPGTDLPKTYNGTVDVLNITEGTGYMSISWLQYYIQCSSSGEWQYQYDKRNFAYIHCSIIPLDTNFEVDSSQRVGLLYKNSGSDSNGRWFTLPSYFSTEVATLDR